MATTGISSELLGEAELFSRVSKWASIEHGSASEGEHAVAALIADELRSFGLSVRVEEEQVHGGYWWPIGIPTAVSSLAGFARRGLPAPSWPISASAGTPRRHFAGVSFSKSPSSDTRSPTP